jgi:uncharacterized protein (DUF1800 family)
MSSEEHAGVVAERPRRSVSRREIFSAAGLAAAAFWSSSKAQAAPPQFPADVEPNSLLSRLSARITMGVTEEEMNLARTLGYEGYLEYHLAYESIDDSALNAMLANQTRFSTLTMTYEQMLGVTAGQVANECMDAAVVRCVFSKRQLFERMVEFWTDHFNIDIAGDRSNRLKPIDDRDVIRAHAMGNFRTLLDASAHSPAMLYYLNNDISVAGNPNENYARELMELHTLGVDGGYTQQDVIEVARCFTGWTIWRDGLGAQSGTFRYNSGVHDTGQKVVLGNIIPARTAAAGIQDGLDVLNILLNHPNTAAYVSGKLCRWLLGYDVPQSVVDSVAGVYTSTQGDIRAMIRQALRPNHLAAAGLKYKRPWHQFISAMRAVPTAVNVTTALRSRLISAGQPRFGWATPDGYPDDLEYWVGNIMPRWNFGADLMNNGISGLSANTTGLFTGLTTATQVLNKINSLLFAGEMSPAESQRIANYIQPAPTGSTQQREALGLAMGAPSFQWY